MSVDYETQHAEPSSIVQLDVARLIQRLFWPCIASYQSRLHKAYAACISEHELMQCPRLQPQTPVRGNGCTQLRRPKPMIATFVLNVVPLENFSAAHCLIIRFRGCCEVDVRSDFAVGEMYGRGAELIFNVHSTARYTSLHLFSLCVWFNVAR